MKLAHMPNIPTTANITTTTTAIDYNFEGIHILIGKQNSNFCKLKTCYRSCTDSILSVKLLCFACSYKHTLMNVFMLKNAYLGIPS